MRGQQRPRGKGRPSSARMACGSAAAPDARPVGPRLYWAGSSRRQPKDLRARATVCHVSEASVMRGSVKGQG